MNKKTFYIYLTLIVLIGFGLRLTDYDRVPAWNESLDEIHYAWTGMTWLRTGVPKSWSWLSSYSNGEKVRIWDTDFRLVSPMLEKPPLYSLLSGALILSFGQDELAEVRISTIRLLPLFLSIFSIFLTGMVGHRVFSSHVGLIASLLYATVPPIVMANRLSVTENLLTPLMLTAQVLFLTVTYKLDRRPHAIFVSIISSLAILTKQIGATIALVSLLLYVVQRKWKPFLVCSLISGLVFLIYPLTGLIYDWQLFGSVQREQRRIGLQGGLPQLVQTIVTRPLITTENLFPDGTLLLGYILFFASPWWLLNSPISLREEQATKPGTRRYLAKQSQRLPHLTIAGFAMTYGYNWPKLVFLAFPFAYLVYLAISTTGAEPIGSGQAFWGWYAYPLFPYVTILVAYVLTNLWKQFSLLQGLILTLILGSSTIRYVFLFLPREHHYLWQHALIGLLITIMGTWLLPSTKNKKIVLLGIFGLYTVVNVYVSIRLSSLYPNLPQP